jgi:hypothetical protein
MIRAMTSPGSPTSSAEVTIAADPDAVYALISDLPTLTELAEETTAMNWCKGDSAGPGAKFRGENRNGRHKWTTTCTVTDATPGETFAFDVHSAVIPVAHWRYEIAPTATGCRVTESTWDRRPGWFRKIGEYATGVHNRNAANATNIERTLQRLKARAER